MTDQQNAQAGNQPLSTNTSAHQGPNNPNVWNGDPLYGEIAASGGPGSAQNGGNTDGYSLNAQATAPINTTGTSGLGVSTPGTNTNAAGQNGVGGSANYNWSPSLGGGIMAPVAAAYDPQNAQGLLNIAAQNAGLASGAAASAQTAGGQMVAAPAQYSAAGISPLMMLNGGANINTTGMNQNVTAQQASINNLNNIASGNGPNAATIAAAQQSQQNTAAQMAAIASAGGNPALAQRNAQAAAAQSRQQASQQAVLGSAQEQLGAQGTLQTALGTLAGQGQTVPLAQAQFAQQAALANQGVQSQGALSQAQMQQQATGTNAAAQNAAILQASQMSQQTALANQQAQLSGTSMDINQQNAMLSAAMQQSSFDTAQNEAYQQQYQQAQENIAALNAGQGIAQMQQTGQLVGSGISATGAVIGGLAAAGSLSDRRGKTNIQPANRDINVFLNTLGVKQNKYNWRMP